MEHKYMQNSLTQALTTLSVWLLPWTQQWAIQQPAALTALMSILGCGYFARWNWYFRSIYVLVWTWPNSLIWLLFFDFSVITWDEYTGLVTRSHNSDHKLGYSLLIKERERKRREIKSHNSLIKETSVRVSHNRREKVKSSCGRHSQTPGRFLIRK